MFKNGHDFTDKNCIILNKDPINTYYTQFKEQPKYIKGIIDNKRKYLYIYINPCLRIMKAIPKLHKQNIPVRPLINAMPVPTYKVFKTIAKIFEEQGKLNNT